MEGEYEAYDMQQVVCDIYGSRVPEAWYSSNQQGDNTSTDTECRQIREYCARILKLTARQDVDYATVTQECEKMFLVAAHANQKKIAVCSLSFTVPPPSPLLRGYVL